VGVVVASASVASAGGPALESAGEPMTGTALVPLTRVGAIAEARMSNVGVSVSRSRSREPVAEVYVRARAAAAPTAPVATPSASATPTQKPAAAPAAPRATVSTSAFDAAAARIGLRGYARVVYSAVRSTYGITNLGGYRAGDPGDHGSGLAVDVMITSLAQGDAVAAYVIAHAAEFHVKYVIWRQRIWTPGGTWRAMADRGGATANHFDHVHVSVTG